MNLKSTIRRIKQLALLSILSLSWVIQLNAAEIEVPLTAGSKDQQIVIRFDNPTQNAVRDVEISISSLASWASKTTLSTNRIPLIEVDGFIEIVLEFDVNKEINEATESAIVLDFDYKGELSQLDTYQLVVTTVFSETTDDVESTAQSGGESKEENEESEPTQFDAVIAYLSEIRNRTPYSSSNPNYNITSSPGVAGWEETIVSEGISEEITNTTQRSAVITQFPYQIVLGEDYEIESELRVQASETAGACNRTSSPNEGITVLFKQGVSPLMTAFKVTNIDVPCIKSGGRFGEQPAWKAGDTVNLNVTCKFQSIVNSSSTERQYKYICEGSSNGEVTTNSDTIVFIARKENDAYIASGLVFDFQDIGLVYSGEEVSTEATPGSHSFEVVNEIGATTPDQTIVKEPRDDDNKTNVDEPDEVNENNSDQTGSDVSDEIASANSSDVGHQSIGDTDASTSKLNPNNPEISRLISQWIRLAKPPSNATHGHDYRYEKWGRFIGTNVDGVIVTANQKPQDAKGKSSMEYVWGKKDKLDSVDHCTLGKYVESSVRGKSLDDCKGRYKPIVPNMVGMPFQLATERLSKLQLTPELKAGTPAPSTEKSKTIERQSIEVGSTLDRGDSISIWIHTPYVEKIEVPNLLGRTFADAKSEIESLGLNLKIEIGDSAEDKDSEGAVQSQAPRPGTIVKIESLITLKLFSPPVNSLTSPNVVGMTRSEALALLKSQGFRVTIIDGSTTIDYESQGRVEAQIPPAGSRIKKDGKIILAIFSTPEYQRIVGDYVGRELESVRSELKSEGLDIQVFMGDMATSQDANWTVQNQTPIPGSRAKVGETVELTLFTKFVETATIPNVEGMSVSQAKSTIEKEGLAVRFSIGAQAPNSQKSGKVISSNPPEGNSVKLGSTVSLSVYAAFIDTVVIPRLQGKTGSEAKRTLDKAGFDVQFKIGQSAPYSSKAGTVISTNPTEGLTVKPGTTVEVTVYANAVQTIRVPNVIGRYGSAATRQIQGMGLKATIKYAGPAESQADVNKVIRQSPSGNSVAAAGTTIILEILAQVDSQASQSAAASQSNTSSSVKKHACGDSTVPYTGSFTSFQSSGHSSSRIRQMKGDDVACVFSTVSPGYFSITDLSVTFWYCKSDFSSCGPASEFHPIRHIENGNGYRDYHHDRGWFRISPY